MSQELADLTSVTSEFEAATIVESLRAQGIPAQHLGGGLAGFRAEVPSLVRVVVRQRDLERARLALRAIQAESVDIDWDEVDVGTPEDATRESLPDASGYRCARCGYSMTHMPVERPCPECGLGSGQRPDRGGALDDSPGDAATVAQDSAPATTGPSTNSAARRDALRGLMGQVGLALLALIGASALGAPFVIELALAATVLALAAVIMVRFFRGR